MIGHAGTPAGTMHAGMTLTRSKVNVKVTGLLNFRQLAKPYMLVAMTAAPFRGFLVYFAFSFFIVHILRLLFILKKLDDDDEVAILPLDILPSVVGDKYCADFPAAGCPSPNQQCQITLTAIRENHPTTLSSLDP